MCIFADVNKRKVCIVRHATSTCESQISKFPPDCNKAWTLESGWRFQFSFQLLPRRSVDLRICYGLVCIDLYFYWNVLYTEWMKRLKRLVSSSMFTMLTIFIYCLVCWHILIQCQAFYWPRVARRSGPRNVYVGTTYLRFIILPSNFVIFRHFSHLSNLVSHCRIQIAFFVISRICLT